MAEATRITKTTRSMLKENPGLTDFGQKYINLPPEEQRQLDGEKETVGKSLSQLNRSMKRHLTFVTNNINKPSFTLMEAQQLQANL